MARARIKIIPEGIAELLKSEGVQADLRARMERVRAAAKSSPDLPDCVDVSDVTVWVGHDRARATVALPSSIEAQHGILARALDSARDT